MTEEQQAKYGGKEDTPITYSPGSTITLTKLQKDFLGTILKHEEAAQAGLYHFSQTLQKARKQLFDVLYDFYPELENYHYEYHGDIGEIGIVAKKSKKL